MIVIGRRKPKKGNKVGGVVISFETFIDYFKKQGWDISVIDLSWRNYHNKFFFTVQVYFQIFVKILFTRDAKISFHGTTFDFTYFAPLVVFLSNLRAKRVTLRQFGGSFDLYFNGLKGIQKKIVRYALSNSDCVFLQTKYLVKKFSWLENTVWLPTHRNIEPNSKIDKTFTKKFVFVSHIKATKGVNIILKAISKLSNEYIIHLYGPIKEYSPPECLSSVFEEHYFGALKPDEVLQTMRKYDVLLLPTFHKGEGYPGAILEAYSQGLPVISTRWRAIPEIVDDGKTGYLVEPRSVSELVKAIKVINLESYSQLSKNAKSSFEKFKRDRVLKKVAEYL